MASVFLSYVRDDVEKAQTLAALLERAGHSVWWDRRIKGGAQFSAEIEAALNAADKVVVLWSAKAIGSAWVRDEAAVGRDSGRLVPASLDSTPAPLGFRQFQTIDLSHWKGRSQPGNFNELLEAIGDRSGQPAEHRPAPAPKASKRELKLPRPATLAIAAAAAALVIGGGWWWSSGAKAHTPVVTVNAANDSQQSKDAAQDLAVQLGDSQSASTDNFQLISGAGPADLIFEVGAGKSGGSARRDLTVLSGANRAILWSTSFQQAAGQPDTVARQLNLTSQRVLKCALDALGDTRDAIDPGTVKLYVGGCLRLEGLYGNSQYNPEVLGAFERVVAIAPHMAAGWAKLLSAESEIVVGPDPPPQLVAKLKRHIATVEKLGLPIGEIYLAKAALVAPADYLDRLAFYDEGIKIDPSNPLLYRIRSEREFAVGRVSDAVQDSAQSLQLDPNSPAAQDNYISTLAYAGQITSAYDQLRKSEAMWPTALNIQTARYRLDLRYGDPKSALAEFQAQSFATAGISKVAFIQARIDPTPENIQKAIDAELSVNRIEPRDIEGLMQAYVQFGRYDDAIDVLLNYKRPDAIGYNSEVMFRPAFKNMWRNPRAIAASAHAGLLEYWVKSGKWPDFCADPTLPYNCKAEAAKYRV